MADREICELMNTDVEQGLYKLIEKYNAYVKSIVSRAEMAELSERLLAQYKDGQYKEL